MRFVDEVEISVRAGKGGRGGASFRREKHVPYGGPDGGDGGNGGSVILVARNNVNTLVDIRYTPRLYARDGRPGSRHNRTGAGADDRVVPVPVGTLVRDRKTGVLLGDLTEVGQQLVVARGGKGGRGNARFQTSTNRAPTRYDEGLPGDECELFLELKLIADVGLVGYPNAGKSTLISKLSASRPKIADYPFTTLVPNLGVVRVDDERSFVMADIPGLIEGASDGIGLGHKFLRHVERTRVFLHLVSLDEQEMIPPLTRFEKLTRELASYDSALSQRPQFIVLSKIDVFPEPDKMLPPLVEAFEALGARVYPISAVSGVGLRELIFDVVRLLESTQESPGEESD